MRDIYPYIFRFEAFVVACCLVIVGVSSVASAIQFEDITDSAGISYVGPSFGVSWGDVNGDGWPDVWAGNHANIPALYVNNMDGTFSDEIFGVGYSFSDRHGAAWADFDNDGDQDLMVLAGAQSGFGVGPNQLFVNISGVLDEQALTYGLRYPLGRGRTPLWFDWNRDGKLDIFLSNGSRIDGQAPSTLFTQLDGRFSDSAAQTGLTVTSNSLAQLLTVGNSAYPSLLLAGSPYPDRFYNYQSTPFVEQGGLFALTDDEKWNVVDVAIADFNGDLLTDIFLVRSVIGSEVIQTDPNRISAQLVTIASEKTFTFRADGAVQFEIGPSVVISPSRIFIGNRGVNPEGHIFSVSSLDPDVVGVFPHAAGADNGVYIGFDSQTGLWSVVASSTNWLSAGMMITADGPVTSLTYVDFERSDGAFPDKLFLQSVSGFVERSAISGLSTATACRSAVAADFDNDMDVDLYLVCGGPATNIPNILYENTGDGRFRLVADAGGAAGAVTGIAESVAAADYDQDGYMDIFVTNGLGGTPFNRGPSQLFRNTGGLNHWIEIDLEGVTSNRDGVGARVLLTAAGVAQVRDQDGGMHRFSQNNKRIHFGLAGAAIVDRIEVFWPSGKHQVYNDVAVDQVIKIKEGMAQPITNDPPVITGLQNQVVNEDMATAVLPFMVSDSETDTALLIVTARSSDQELIPDANLKLGGNGSERTIVVTPTAERNGGPVIITVSVDDGKDVVTGAFGVTVSAVNDPPVAQSDNASVRVGEVVNIPVAANDNDVDNSLDMASIEIVSGPGKGTVAVKPNGSIEYFNTYPDTNSDSFTYRIKDVSGAVSSVADVTVTIVPLFDSAGKIISFSEAVGQGLDPDAPNGDTDNDGLSDIVEVGGDITNPLDTDSDGVIDALEKADYAVDASVIDGLVLLNGGRVKISTAGVEVLSNPAVVPIAEKPPGIDFLFGAIGYSTTSTPGGSVTITMDFSDGLPENTVIYKLDSGGGYVELPEKIWRQLNATTISVDITDGDVLTDADGVVDGSIHDPIAVGARKLASVAGQVGGGGGCALVKADAADPILPMLVIIALLGLIFRCSVACKYEVYSR